MAIGAPASARLPVGPSASSASSSSQAAQPAAPGAQGQGVAARDLPAVQRVASLPDEAVNPSSMTFPGNYDRHGRVEPDGSAGGQQGEELEADAESELEGEAPVPEVGEVAAEGAPVLEVGAVAAEGTPASDGETP